MGSYINASLAYHEGDPIVGDTAVPQRPDSTYDWTGSAWVVNSSRLPVLYATGLGWSMGIDQACLDAYNNDANTIAVFQAFLAMTSNGSLNLSQSFKIKDCTGAMQATTLGQAITIYNAFWTWYKSL